LTYLSSLAPGMRGGLTQEQQLSYWAWEMVLKLRLHKLEQPHLPMETHDYGSHEWSKDIPDMTSDPNLHPIQKGVKALGPLACYVAITMTKVGHSVDLFLADGINYHVNLVSTGYHKASIHVLSVIVPMFIQTPQYLLENEKFERIIQCIVHADRSVYGFTGKLIMQQVFPGDITKMFCSMIMHQLQCAGTPGGISRNDVLEFWFRALASVEYWTQDRDVQYLLDCLTRAAFMYKGSENLILEILFSMYKSLLGANKEQSVLSSLVSWISSSMPSLMEKPSQEFSWLAYAVLSIESRYEEDSQMRNVVYQLLSRDSKLTPDAALKKACSKLKLPYSPVAGRLSVYRWAYQALETDMDHPLLPAIWQQFFMVYLQRIVSEPGLPQRGSIGLRFFESLANSTLLKRCKKRLVCTADYHHNASKKAGSSSHHASTPDSDSDTNSQHASDGGSTNGRETPPLEQLKYQTSVEYHQCLVK
ncbi:ectopic P granules protein 5 homolog, partial [Saccoglossus kowalevskii]